jgi:PPOX class probable F420-dependent enzyme
MELTAEQRAFLEANHGAVMVTLRPDGTPHAVRVGVALVEGKLWSSGTADRVRTRHLRRDPRSTLTVFPSAYGFLTVEARVRIIDGPSAASSSLQLFRVMQNRPEGPVLWSGSPLEPDAFMEQMVKEQRLIYEFEPQRIYGFALSGPPLRSR